MTGETILAGEESHQRQTADTFRARKGGTPLVCLTAYTAPVAKLLDPHCDMLLVGDSLAMVVYGMNGTVGVDLDTMIRHGDAVVRASEQALVVIDMPAGSYETDRVEAVANAKRVVDETGAGAVKLEGGVDMAETVAAIVDAGIPVVGHVGLLPQRAEAEGGFRIKGKDDAGARQVVADAQAIARAGACALVIEGTIEPVAREITRRISIPTIGIGASPACDGQVLVIDDVTGLFTEFQPKFVKRYGNVAEAISTAAKSYADDVRSRRFPGPEHVYNAD